MGRHGATACLLLLATQACAQNRPVSLQKIEYLVGELPEQPQQLTITRDAVRYESHSNLSRPGSMGIGVFGRPLAAGEMDAIGSALDPAGFRSLPDHRGQVLSGDRWKRIRLTTDAGTIEKLVGTKRPVDPELQKAIDRLDRLAEETTRYPQRVLEIGVRDPAFNRDGEFSATVSLTPRGDQPVAFRPPTGQIDSLVVFWWASGPGGAGKDVQSAPVTLVEPVSGGKPGEPPSAYRIRSRLGGASSGSLAVQIRYANMTPQADAPGVLVGELYSAPVVLR